MMSCTRCAELEVKLSTSVPRETVGSIMATLQAAQEKTVALIQTERQANLYTPEEAHFILAVLCDVPVPESAVSARAGILALLATQQPEVYAQYQAMIQETPA